MADYRVYSIGNDGHAFEALLLDCPDDKAAIESAKELIYDHDIELWQQDRLIPKFTGKPVSGSASSGREEVRARACQYCSASRECRCYHLIRGTTHAAV